MPLLTTRRFAALALLALAGWRADAADVKSKLTREYDLKAAFLFNFAHFVEWPAGSFPDATAPVVIGVLGDDPFGRSLDVIVADQIVRGREVIVRRYHDVQEIADCHILYISASEASRLPAILQALNGKNILTVGESDGFNQNNGIVRFVITGNKLHLRINVDAANAARLTISSQLLRQAEIVSGK